MIINEYSDKVEYNEKVIEIAWRRGSIEVNEHWASVKGVRIFKNGCWSIVSVQGRPVDYKLLEEKAYKLIQNTSKCSDIGLLEDKRCKGEYTIGYKTDIDNLINIVQYIKDRGVDGEVILLYEDINRIIDDGSTRCIERKHVYQLSIFYELKTQGKVSVGSSSIAFSGSITDLVKRHIDALIEEAKLRAKSALSAKKLSPLETGKTTLVLGHEVSAVFFHEIAHVLEGDIPQHLGIGQRLSTTSISIREDPFYPWSPTSTFFDDEGIMARRKSLVEDGEVVDLLHTRSSAAKMYIEGYSDVTPGQARGLFHVPKAIHTTLVIEPGDWREKEIIEETRKGILIDGVIRAEIYEGMIIIVPEIAWRIESGELVEPVFVRQVKLPLFRALTTIDAIGKSLRLRASIEKGYRVSEVAPVIRLQGYIEA